MEQTITFFFAKMTLGKAVLVFLVGLVVLMCLVQVLQSLVYHLKVKAHRRRIDDIFKK